MNDPEALTIVVGYDGSVAARRGLARVRGLGARAGRALVAAVARHFAGAGLRVEAMDRVRMARLRVSIAEPDRLTRR